MRQFQMRYSDDEQPIVWFAVAGWYRGRDGRPVATASDAASPHLSYRVAAEFDPLSALFALCDDVIDGEQCAHCGKPTGFMQDVEHTALDHVICWYVWDPETSSYMRGCEASNP
jgi:hypothetical protein